MEGIMKWIGFFLALSGCVGCIAQPDSDHIDIIMPEVTLQSGEEEFFCFKLTYDGPDTGITLFETLEAAPGYENHHVLLMKARNPSLIPDGVSKCTHIGSLGNLDPVMFPDTPVGLRRAMPLASGTTLVLQVHYLNTGKETRSFPTTARLHTLAPAHVEQWVGIMALSKLKLDILPHQQTTVDFSCTVPRDFNLLMVGGHMHDIGDEITLSHHEEGEPHAERIYPTTADTRWYPAFRDDPPMEWPFRQLARSSVLSVHCAWTNASDDLIRFPREMCAIFGYVEDPGAPKGAFPTGDTGFYCIQ
jgi:hypothetical protein